MSKKLKAELEVETAKAKRQVREAVEGGASSSAASPEAGAGRAARQVRDLGAAAERTQGNLRAAGKAFAGMAVGLAASYAARQMRPGGARDAVEYGGAALGGAAAGMMFGPIGAALGGIAGLLKTYLDKQGARDDLIKDYTQGEAIYRASREQMRKFASLADPRKNGGDISGNVPEMRRISENYKRSTERFLTLIAEELKRSSPDAERVATLKRNVDWARAMADRYDAAIESAELAPKKAAHRASTAGTDALARVGGSLYGPAASAAPGAGSPAAAGPSRARGFGFAVPASRIAELSYGGPSAATDTDRAIRAAAERSAALDKEISDTLKAIERNTKGGDTWR